jgi:putative DNA-invertase from lambdoid prophage Rac
MMAATPRTIAYIRVSSDLQDVDKQRLEILDYANRCGFKVDEFTSIEISSRKTAKEPGLLP